MWFVDSVGGEFSLRIVKAHILKAHIVKAHIVKLQKQAKEKTPNLQKFQTSNFVTLFDTSRKPKFIHTSIYITCFAYFRFHSLFRLFCTGCYSSFFRFCTQKSHPLLLHHEITPRFRLAHYRCFVCQDRCSDWYVTAKHHFTFFFLFPAFPQTYTNLLQQSPWAH